MPKEFASVGKASPALSAPFTRTSGRVQGWFSLFALALWFTVLGAHGQAGPAVVSQARVGSVLNAPGVRVRAPRSPSAVPGTSQAWETEDETGPVASDLIPVQPVALPGPGRPAGCGRGIDPGPPLPSGCAAGGSRPRPPPGLTQT
jgi:hypothetical protein